jgi:cytochrome c oxidase subunit 4
MADSHDAHAHPPYKFIFGVLCLFTGISWLADELKDFIPGAGLLAVIVLGVATVKALCVMLYFMHLKFERPWKYVLLAPTCILAIGLPLALLPDIGVHYYVVDVPQDSITSRLETPHDAGDEDQHGGGQHD